MDNSKTVIILGSSRSNGNTRAILDELTQGQIELVDLNDYKISYFDYNHENQVDDFLPLMERLIENFDHFILASPIYWYMISAQMKCFLDRFTDLLTIKKELGRKLRGKNISLISCSNADDFVGDFSIPIRSTSEYLGMNFKFYTHFWKTDDQKIPKEVLLRIEHLRNKILK